MKLSFLLLLVSGTAFGVEEALVSPSRNASDSVAERRAEAMGTELERFETMKGRVYQDVRITEINGGGISFTHADGAGRLRYEDLSPEQRRYFGIGEETAAQIYRKEREARLAYEKKVEEREAARKKAAAEQAEARRLAEEKAAKERAERVEAVAFRDIPALPEVKRVDRGPFSERRHSRYRSSYVDRGYYYSGYYPRYRASGGVRFGRAGGYCGSRSPGFVIRW